MSSAAPRDPSHPAAVAAAGSSASSETMALRKANLVQLAAWSGIAGFENEDQKVALWYEENRKTVHEKIERIRTESVAYDVASLMRGSKEGGLKGVRDVLQMLPVGEREEVLKFLAQA